MDPFGDDKNKRKRRNPFDFFGFDDDFINDILNDERLMDDIRRMTEEMMKMFSTAQPGKAVVHGFKINFGPDGRPRIQEFGNRPLKSPKGEQMISEEREPLTDIIEGDEDVAVTVEIPGVEKEDIDLHVTGDVLEITVNNPQRKYHKRLNLPCDVLPKTTKATYKNGILDVVIKRKEKKKPGEGYKVNIE
ncbi:MAG: Hsp20/alpha crystallin family protein [Candidatus Thermoplasmatota archaeon]|jgi:HSP20 family protein|nr:Hsp20/alpha crystallin family protein [Candidatus Thermoplasmatota archaeon]